MMVICACETILADKLSFPLFDEVAPRTEIFPKELIPCKPTAHYANIMCRRILTFISRAVRRIKGCITHSEVESFTIHPHYELLCSLFRLLRKYSHRVICISYYHGFKQVFNCYFIAGLKPYDSSFSTLNTLRSSKFCRKQIASGLYILSYQKQ